MPTQALPKGGMFRMTYDYDSIKIKTNIWLYE